MAVQQSHYKEKIQQAKNAYDEADYETAKFKAEEALSFMPESKEAQRIKDDSQRRIKSQKDLERYLDRADLFIAQKAYNEASQELQKARLLDVDDKEIVERENKIAKEQGAVKELVSNLSNSLNLAISEKRFNDALRFCSELIEVDFANSRKWSVKIADIKNQQEKTEENEKRWRNLLHDIDTAHLSEDWEKLVSLCKEALGIQEDSSIRTKLKKAEEKLNEIQSIKLVDEMIVEIKDLILDADFETAKSKLSAIRKMNLNPVTETKVKELNALIFQKEDEAEIAKGGKKKQPHDNNESASVGGRNVVKGFSMGEKRSSIDDDFFSSPSPSHKVNNKPKKEVAKQGKSIPQKNDDFFDNNSEKATKGKNKSKQHGVITNDDFDF